MAVRYVNMTRDRLIQELIRRDEQIEHMRAEVERAEVKVLAVRAMKARMVAEEMIAIPDLDRTG